MVVPQHVSEDMMEEALAKGEAAALVSRVFTTEYASAIVEGRIHRVDDEPWIRWRCVPCAKNTCQKYVPNRLRFVDCVLA